MTSGGTEKVLLCFVFLLWNCSSQQQDSDIREHCPVQKLAFCDLHFDPMFGSQEEKRRKAKLANAFAFGNDDDDDKREQERIAAAKQAVPDSASNNFARVASKMTTTLLSHL